MLIEPPKKSNKSFLILIALLALGVASFYLFIGDFSNLAKGPSSFTIQNFWGKTQISSGSKSWQTPERSKQLQIGDRVKTGPDGGLDIKFKGTRVRVKENAEIRIQAPKNGSDRIQLKNGILLISSNTPLQINVPGLFENAEIFSRLIVTASRGIFSVGTERAKKIAWVRVLTGKTNAMAGWGRPGLIKELEKAESGPSKKIKITDLSQNEWKNMSEAYELISKSPTDTALQLDLAKKSGNFFDRVFDHGTFYDPKSGFCERDFIQDPATGEVYLEARYDVFPRQALVGIYFKTRNFEISKYETLKFEMRRVPDAGYPEKFLFEVKYKGQIVRKYLAKMVRTEWTSVEFPLNFQKETPVDEITITFANEQVGALKKGSIHLRNFQLALKPAPPKEEAPAAPSIKQAAVPPPPAVVVAAKPTPAAATTSTQQTSAPVTEPVSSESLRL